MLKMLSEATSASILKISDLPVGQSVTYISNCIPKNMPADLKTLIRVSGDFFSLFGKGGGGGGICNGRRL